jgi:Protein of unknown function (DUF3096)
MIAALLHMFRRQSVLTREVLTVASPSRAESLRDVIAVRLSHREGERTMTIGVAHLSPVLSIIFGVLILIMPRFLNYFVAVYLILAGLLGLGVFR